MYYIETGSTDPCYNLAFEEYVLKNRTEGDWLMLWQNDNTVVVGLNQTAQEEINREYVDAMGVNVVRRRTGGGAVYHDLGNLNYSFISDTGALEEMTLQHFSEPVCRALKTMGLDAVCSGRNDILIDGRKISGTAQRIEKNRILYHGTLLFDSDLDAAAAALRADPSKFSSKSTKSVRSRIGNIREMLAEDMTLAEFRSRIMAELAEEDITVCSLDEEELAAVEELALVYRSREWTYGKGPKFGYNNRKRCEGGTLGVSAEIDKGVIQDIMFFGDFMASTDCTAACEVLRGVAFEPEAVIKALSGLELAPMFGGISAGDICGLLFD
ncbi:MAG: lipoate--protein ligase [Oscillospiraceae bacterium]|nr:lipoate--protein ligase [Oscillospiraceae bacterium]